MMNNNASINRLRPVIVSFLVMTLISIAPIINFINLFFCAGIMLGSVVGVLYFNKQLIQVNCVLKYNDAVLIGLLSGFLSAVAVSGFNIVTLMYSSVNPINESLKMLGDFAKNLPPEADNQIRLLSDEFNKFGYSPTLAIFTFISNMIIYPLFGVIGAIITATVLNKRNVNNINK